MKTRKLQNTVKPQAAQLTQPTPANIWIINGNMKFLYHYEIYMHSSSKKKKTSKRLKQISSFNILNKKQQRQNPQCGLILLGPYENSLIFRCCIWIFSLCPWSSSGETQWCTWGKARSIETVHIGFEFTNVKVTLLHYLN